MLITVMGANGGGSTTACALVLRALRGAGVGPLLAVDADPRPRLHRLLGMPRPGAVEGLRGELLATGSGGASREGLVEALLNQRVVEGEMIDLVAIGRSVEAEGERSVEITLRRSLARLAANYRAVVVDEAGGVEPFARRNLAVIDHLVIVAGPAPREVAAALAIAGLADRHSLRVQKRWLLVNRSRGAADGVTSVVPPLPGGFHLLGAVPDDPLLPAWEGEGRSFLALPGSSPAAAAVEKAVRQCLLDRTGLDTRCILDV